MTYKILCRIMDKYTASCATIKSCEMENGMKKNPDLMKLLNLSYLRYSNKTKSCGSMDLPALYCNTKIYPDFLALYSEPGLYHKTNRTAVCFHEFDTDFDGKNGLFWAIYYDEKRKLEYFRNRFKGVRFFLGPDYSELGDVHTIENNYRLFKSRIVSLWLIFELNATVIPNISFPDKNSYAFALDGLEKCEVVAISTKGHMDNDAENKRLRDNIRFTVDRLCLKAIIVYDVCGTNEPVLNTFSYAIEKGVSVVIPDNTLKHQNCLRFERGVVDL